MNNTTTPAVEAILKAASDAETEYLAAASERGASDQMTPRERRAILGTERTLVALAHAIPSVPAAQALADYRRRAVTV